MRLCDRCPGSGNCLLDYLGKACDRWRKTDAPDVFVTNADRIRAMSYKELAKLFTHTVADGCPPDMDWECTKDCDGWDGCDACWERWLQQPAGEE